MMHPNYRNEDCEYCDSEATMSQGFGTSEGMAYRLLCDPCYSMTRQRLPHSNAIPTLVEWWATKEAE